MTAPARSSRADRTEDVRRRNLSTVLRYVHVHGATARSRLTSDLGLNRSTIGDLTGDPSAHLVREVAGRSERLSTGPASSGGRPSFLVMPESEGVQVLASRSARRTSRSPGSGSAVRCSPVATGPTGAGPASAASSRPPYGPGVSCSVRSATTWAWPVWESPSRAPCAASTVPCASRPTWGGATCLWARCSPKPSSCRSRSATTPTSGCEQSTCGARRPGSTRCTSPGTPGSVRASSPEVPCSAEWPAARQRGRARRGRSRWRWRRRPGRLLRPSRGGRRGRAACTPGGGRWLARHGRPRQRAQPGGRHHGRCAGRGAPGGRPHRAGGLRGRHAGRTARAGPHRASRARIGLQPHRCGELAFEALLSEPLLALPRPRRA